MVMRLDFSRTFDIIFHAIHICKLRKYGLDKLTIRGLENCLGHNAERVVGSGLKSQLVAGTTVFQSSVSFSIFIDSLDDETKSIFSKFVDSTKLKGRVVQLTC